MRYTQGGTAYATFTLAVDRRKDKDGNRQADFIPCVAWSKLAEVIANNLAKGRRIGIEGRLQTRTYEAQDGSKRSAFDIVVEEMEFLDSKGGGGGRQGAGYPRDNFGGDISDEEIPF